MYYEVHGGGEPVVLLHGAFMTITNNWAGWIGELSKTRKVIAVEMQGHGRTAQLSQDPASGPYRLQHGRSRGDAVCDPPSGQSAKGSHHFVHVPP
jgi:pimeloyl-ACP methyl ester carboxylesterase